MSRIRFGAALLLLLLVAGIFTAWNMTHWSEEIAGQLDTAARQALEDDLQGAEQTLQQAQTRWQQRWGINAAIADHDPLEQIDVGFAQLQVYGDSGERIPFAALCAQLAQQIRAIGESGGATWKNIL